MKRAILLLASRDILPGGMFAPQQQKFHTDDVNQCLHNLSGCFGVPNVNLFDFMFSLFDYGEVNFVFLCEQPP